MQNIKPAKRLDKFPEYIFSRLAKEVADVEQKTGRKVLSFGPGTPDIPPSRKYVDQLAKYIYESDAHLYPGYGAIPDFAQALANWYEKRFHVHLENDEILPLLGAKDGISHLPLAILNEGDEVLVPNPGYPAFTGTTLMLGGKVVYYDLLDSNHFKMDLDDIQTKITTKTKYIWVNFPSNPTGQTITINEIEKVVDFAKKNGIFVIYDNAYSEVTYDGAVAPSILGIDGAKEICVEIGSFSKTFSFAGYRMGWMVGNKEVIKLLAKVKSQVDSGLSIPLQRLGAYALDNTDTKWHKEMLSSYKNRRDIIAKYLHSLGLTFDMPRGGLYIWAKIPESASDSTEFCMRLLRENQILLTPGTAFGSNGNMYVRVSFCVNIDNIEKYFKI